MGGGNAIVVDTSIARGGAGTNRRIVSSYLIGLMAYYIETDFFFIYCTCKTLKNIYRMCNSNYTCRCNAIGNKQIQNEHNWKRI